MKFPAPTPSKERRGHYKTFLQECLNETKRYGHEGQPTAVADNLGSCQFGCKAYSFKSKTAKARHISVFHRRQSEVAPVSQIYKCNINECGKVFQSLSSLNRHKIKEAHTARLIQKETTGNKRGSKQPSKSRKRQRTLQELLRCGETRDAGDESEDACAAFGMHH